MRCANCGAYNTAGRTVCRVCWKALAAGGVAAPAVPGPQARSQLGGRQGLAALVLALGAIRLNDIALLFLLNLLGLSTGEVSRLFVFAGLLAVPAAALGTAAAFGVVAAPRKLLDVRTLLIGSGLLVGIVALLTDSGALQVWHVTILGSLSQGLAYLALSLIAWRWAHPTDRSGSIRLVVALTATYFVVPAAGLTVTGSLGWASIFWLTTVMLVAAGAVARTEPS